MRISKRLITIVMFIALAISLLMIGVWAVTDTNFQVTGNIQYTSPVVDADTHEYLTFSYSDETETAAASASLSAKDTTLTAAITDCLTTVTSVEIPKWVRHNDKTYTVTTIASGGMISGAAFLDVGSSLTDKTLIIPETITTIEYGAFYRSGFEEITILGNISAIEGQTFGSCSSLTKITIPENVTSIGESAFFGCSALTNITIPDSVESIGTYAFGSCKNLQSIVIPEKITTINNQTFFNCTSLSSVTFSEGLKTIGGSAFQGCSKLSNVVFPSSLTTISSNAFSSCDLLTDITIPENVSSIGSAAFSGLTSIKVNEYNPVYNSKDDCNAVIKTSTNELILGSDNTTILDSVTSIANFAFSGCSFTTINIPNSVTSISNRAFESCSALTDITIPSSVTSFGGSVFMNCTSLATATLLPETSFTTSSSVFSSCSSLTAIYTQFDLVDVYKNSTNWSSYSDKIVAIDAGVFSYLTFSYDETAKTASVIDCDTSVVNVIIPSSIAYNSEKYTVTAIANNTNSGISSGAFYGCNSMETIDIPDTVTSIANYSFYGCKALKSLHIPKGVASISSSAVIAAMSNLMSITVDDENTVYEDRDSNAIFHIANNELVYGCKNTAIKDAVTKINQFAFYASSPSTIFLPEGLTTVKSQAFSENSGLKSVTLPESLTTIESYGFYNGDLSSIVIPKNVTSIGGNAFYSHASLDEIYVLADTPPTLGSNVFHYDANGPVSTLQIYVKPNLVDAYKAAWTDYADYIVAIPSTDYYADLGLSFTCDTSTATASVAGSDNTITTANIPAYVSYTVDGTTTVCKVTTIAASAFSEYSSLKTITIPTTVTTIAARAFNRATAFTSLLIPSSVTTIGEGAFYCCYGITTLTLCEGLVSIGANAFAGCVSLTALNIPASVTTLSGNPFYSFYRLKTLTVSDLNTVYADMDCNAIIEKATNTLVSTSLNTVIPASIVTIGKNAYFGMRNTSVIIPKSVTTIEASAFGSTSSYLTNVYYMGTEEEWAAITGDGKAAIESIVTYNYTA